MRNLKNCEHLDEAPAKVFVCRCTQCRYKKATRANRKYKRALKRAMNRARRSADLKHMNKMITYLWA